MLSDDASLAKYSLFHQACNILRVVDVVQNTPGKSWQDRVVTHEHMDHDEVWLFCDNDRNMLGQENMSGILWHACQSPQRCRGLCRAGYTSHRSHNHPCDREFKPKFLHKANRQTSLHALGVKYVMIVASPVYTPAPMERLQFVSIYVAALGEKATSCIYYTMIKWLNKNVLRSELSTV